MMARLVAVLAAIAVVGALSAPGAWAQAVEGDEGFMDLTLPDLSPATVDPDGTYVDPQIRNRGECLDHPGRPEWVMVQPKGMEWRRDLMLAYGRLQIREQVVATNDCSCDHRYPDWEAFRPALTEMVAAFDQIPQMSMERDQQDRLYQLERGLRREASDIGFEFGKACRGTS